MSRDEYLPGPPAATILSRQRLQQLVTEVDPQEQLDDEVEKVLLQMTDDFVEHLLTASCRVAKHRNSKSLQVNDVQLVLEKEWNMNVAGLGADLTTLNQLKSHSVTTDAHRQRLAMIKKNLKRSD